MGLNYLLDLYKEENIREANGLVNALNNEKQLQLLHYPTFVQTVSSGSFAKEYLAQRGLVQDLQSKTEKDKYSAVLQNQFLKAPINQYDWYHSGLLSELLHTVLENILYTGAPEEQFEHYKAVNEKLITEMSTSSKVYNDLVEYLVKFYEKYGFTQAAEHLALRVLGQNKCTVDDSRISLLEQYRKMAVGKIAPPLNFMNSNTKYKNLSEVASNYKVVVFGASWCEACEKEVPQLKEYADSFLTNYNAVIIFISLDTDKDKYASFSAENTSFITSCDYKMWDGNNAKNYCINASPTFYILDKNNKIVGKPKNAIECAAWLYKNK